MRDQNGELAQVDTEPYTTLLRDRLLLGDREKLRFVERELPAFHPHTVHKNSEAAAPIEIDSADADYRVLAESARARQRQHLPHPDGVRRRHNGNVPLNEVYRIRAEAAIRAPWRRCRRSGRAADGRGAVGARRRLRRRPTPPRPRRPARTSPTDPGRRPTIILVAPAAVGPS